MFGLLCSHLDVPEHTVMTVSCTFIHSLEVAINNKTCSYAKLLRSTSDREHIFK